MTEMISNAFQFMRHCLPVFIVFIVLALVAMKLNMKKEIRNRQILMPFIGLAYGIFVAVLVVKGNNFVLAMLHRILEILRNLHINPGALKVYLYNLADSASIDFVARIAGILARLIQRIIDFIRNANIVIFLYFVENIGFLALFMLLKGILIKIMKKAFSKEGCLAEKISTPFYQRYAGDDFIYLRKHCCQARTFLNALNLTVIFGMTILALISCGLYHAELLGYPFSPVVAVIMVGEVAYILGGRTREESGIILEGEDERASHQVNYFIMRDVLRDLFPDKLSSESTTVNNGLINFRTSSEVLDELDDDERPMIETYGSFLAHKHFDGMELDHKYVMAGKDLLTGKSVLFNNPFYYDLIPYLFYPMNRQLLNHKKILVVLGRHGTEDEMEKWCRGGLVSVNNTPTLWRIGVIDSDGEELDVGILTRSMVHDLELHEANREFLENVGMVVIIEPSRLMSTAQTGLNSLVRYSEADGEKPVFVSIDRNCDGLVDALSHVLMVSISEVSATEHHNGTSSYMCWDGDSDHLQHRMLPNLSRYLGFGTELSVEALKNQITETWWYGGDAFPVVDTRWIAGQYYFDLLDYASLPTAQDTLDAKFLVSPDMWSAERRPYQYLTVEDESYNLFEMKRNFATRATKEGFINILSPEYLMKDYMTDNDSIFIADPKAIPYVVADYAHTVRNVVLRLCLRMSVGYVWESELVQELVLIDVPTEDPAGSFWHEICDIHSFGNGDVSDELVYSAQGKEYHFGRNVIAVTRKYNFKAGKMEFCYSIRDRSFIRLYVDVLKNIEYVAEDEMGSYQYLGAEILGQIYQRHLPGQFFTIAGKYYELLRVNSSEKVILRRASDHITGRKSYRQVREYRLDNIRVSEQMGDVKERDGLQISVCLADITVNTPAYWDMDRYNDFETAHRVEINGIPERKYCHKKILKLSFEGGKKKMTPEICRTLTMLINELFVTMFAENQCFIAAVMPGECDIPLTYSIGGCPEENCIYIIEDSQMDIGLLEAVERNINRIFSILCDYLDWEGEAVKKSLNLPVEIPAEPVELPEPSDEEPEGGNKRRRRGLFGLFRRLKEWLAKIFKRKPKQTEKVPVEEEPVVETPEEELPTEEVPAEEIPAEEVPIGEAPEEEVPSGETAEEVVPSEETPSEKTSAEDTSAGETTAEEVLYEVSPAGDKPEKETPADEGATLEFEGDHAVKAEDAPTVYERADYHERRYMLFGGRELPEGILPEETLEFLRDRGYGNSELKQARRGKEYSDMMGDGFVPGLEGKHYCDFCGVMLTGTEYEVLADGRERCMNCGRTAIKTEKEFVDLYHSVMDTLMSCYGIKLNTSITVKMVNSQRLHRALGKTFVPTGNMDGRVLGVAISSGKKYSLLVENGSPKISSAMTMAHELTHIWQYLNWDRKAILEKYGKNNELFIYEGMAKWAEIQYAYLIGETAAAKREEIITRHRDDEYGKGFLIYESRYPLSEGMSLEGETPFMNNPPL